MELFFRFPLKRPDILKMWVHAIKRKNFTPNNYSYLCSEHFHSDDYQIRPGSNIKLLKENAVPSIFNAFPKHLQKTKVVRRQLFRNQQLVNMIILFDYILFYSMFNLINI